MKDEFKEVAIHYLKKKGSFLPFESSLNIEKYCNLKPSPTTINVGSLKAMDLGISHPT